MNLNSKLKVFINLDGYLKIYFSDKKDLQSKLDNIIHALDDISIIKNSDSILDVIFLKRQNYRSPDIDRSINELYDLRNHENDYLDGPVGFRAAKEEFLYLEKTYLEYINQLLNLKFIVELDVDYFCELSSLQRHRDNKIESILI
jgi:hypothetical protein